MGSVPRPKIGYGIYHSAILTLLASQPTVRAVVIGANDGKLNDPLFPIISKFPVRFEILLIEPQKYLLPHLKKNYEFHANYIIHHGAVGPDSELTLYVVSEEAWPDIAAPHAKNWPVYRAPTGVTSTNRGQVQAWLSKHYKGKLSVDGLIEPIVVQCSPLPPLLETYGWPTDGVDLLQIDTEGFDDQVLFSCDLAQTRPKVINFEATSLPEDRKLAIMDHLKGLGYTVIEYSIEALAVLADPKR